MDSGPSLRWGRNDGFLGRRAFFSSLLVLRTIQMIQQIPLLAFPAKAGIQFCRGHRLSPVKRY